MKSDTCHVKLLGLLLGQLLEKFGLLFNSASGHSDNRRDSSQEDVCDRGRRRVSDVHLPLRPQLTQPRSGRLQLRRRLLQVHFRIKLVYFLINRFLIEPLLVS